MAHLQGTRGNDPLVGTDGNDVLNADWLAGSDTMRGGSGDDAYFVNSRGDRVIEHFDAGVDTVHSTIDYALPSQVEHLVLHGPAVEGVGNALANHLTGNDADNHLVGLDGNDTIDGLGGDDVLDGGNGDDRLDGGTGADTLIGGDGNDTYIVDNVHDVIVEVETPYDPNNTEAWYQQYDTVYSSVDFALGSDVWVEEVHLTGHARNAVGNQLDNSLYGTRAANLLDGNDGNDRLFGGAGSDTLNGGNGVDELDGGSGIDTMTGGDGADTYYVDTPADRVIERAGDEGGDVVVSSANILRLYANVEGLQLTGNAHYAVGNELDNYMFGWAQDDTLVGGNGNDYLIGASGMDRLYGGRGDDTLVGGDERNDVFDDASDRLAGGSGHDTFVFSEVGQGMPVDRIVDFDAAEDQIKLSTLQRIGQIEDGLVGGDGCIVDSAVHTGAGLDGMGDGAAGIYADTETGQLWYDPTSGVAGDGVLFARIPRDEVVNLHGHDFLLG